MASSKQYSYHKEHEYYRERWPSDALDYGNLEQYLSAWLDDSQLKSIFCGQLVLDIGAGEATYSRMIAEKYRPEHVIALDLFWERLAPAKRNSILPNFSAIAGDCFRLPFANDTFDVIFGSLVLHQLGGVDEIAVELFRVLKPGGRYVGVEPNFLNLVILNRYLFGTHSSNQYLFRKVHLRHFVKCGFDLGFRYFYWKNPRIRSQFIGTCIGILLIKKNIKICSSQTSHAHSLTIPSGKRQQIIFRMDLLNRMDSELPSIGKLVIARGPLSIFQVIVPWYQTFGFTESLRLAGKLFLGRRVVVAIVHGSEVASYAWLYRFHTFDYPVDPLDCTIALVSTGTFYRCNHLARVLLKQLINVAKELGHSAIFIETAADNGRMISVIESVGSWQKVGVYLRLGERFR